MSETFTLTAEELRAIRDDAWNRGYEVCREGGQKHSPFRRTHKTAEELWDIDHFETLGCDSSCCDYMHGAPHQDMNPFRTLKEHTTDG